MNKPKTLLLFIIVLMFFSACKKNQSDQEGKDLNLSTEELQKVGEDNDFNLHLLKEVAAEEQNNTRNIMISPFSVGMALSMTANGASGSTLTAMRQTLGNPDESEQSVNEYYSKIIKDLPLLDPTTDISIANSIWHKREFTPLPSFLSTNTQAFQARIDALNFKDPSASTTINDWVMHKPKARYPKL